MTVPKPSVASSALNHARRQITLNKGIDVETAAYHLESQLVLAYIALGRAGDAYESAKQFTATYGASPDIWLALAEAATSSGRYAEVLPAVQKAYQIDNSTADIGNQLYGHSEYIQGNVSTAFNAYHKSYSIDPTNIYTLSGLVYCIMEKSHLAEADYQSLNRYVTEITRLDKKYGEEFDGSIKEILKTKNR